jgi:hypothetical protein
MFQKLMHHARGNAVAYVALFVAMGGTAVAATLKANSVGTKQLKNGAVTGGKVAKNTLTGANIQAGTLGTVPNAAKLGGLPPSAYSTITKITAGTDLTGGGNSGNVTLNADETKLQRRVTGSCTTGSAVVGINQDGTVGCANTVTQMMAGSSGAVSGGTSYLAASGLSAPTETEANTEVGAAAIASAAGRLWVNIDTPTPPTGLPLNVILWTVTLDVNGTPTALTCVAGPDVPVCTDPTHSVTIPPGATVDFSVTSSGPGTATPTVVTIGWTDQTLS